MRGAVRGVIRQLQSFRACAHFIAPSKVCVVGPDAARSRVASDVAAALSLRAHASAHLMGAVRNPRTHEELCGRTEREPPAPVRRIGDECTSRDREDSDRGAGRDGAQREQTACVSGEVYFPNTQTQRVSRRRSRDACSTAVGTARAPTGCASTHAPSVAKKAKAQKKR